MPMITNEGITIYEVGRSPTIAPSYLLAIKVGTYKTPHT